MTRGRRPVFSPGLGRREPPSPRRWRAARRGFVLPIVLVLIVTGTGAAAVMLSRQNTQALAVKRHIDHYQEHHGSKGLAEVIDAWLATVPSDPPLDEIVSEQSRVLELVLADDSRASIHLADGQGRALRVFGEVDANGAVDGPAILAELEQLVSGRRLAALTRDAGPAAISVQAAEEPVLRAAMRYVAGEEGEDTADDLVSEILTRRNEEPLTTASLAAIASRVGLETEQRELFNRVLVARPTHFRMRVELHTPVGPRGGGDLAAVYEGIVQVQRGGGVGTRRARVITFQPVRIE